jgi:Uncharacterized protein conserved in bacteria
VQQFGQRSMRDADLVRQRAESPAMAPSPGLRQSGAVSTSTWYRAFAEREAHGVSPTYERLASSVAEDRELLGLLDGLPKPKRQPNLLFAATRYLGGPVEDAGGFHDWTLRHWDKVAAVMRQRRTQTNEPARCATLLPVLARLPQPLALLEVGASAGLCLYPDAYRYRYGDHIVGPPDSLVRFDCAVDGPLPLPAQVPTVVWRTGLDLNPLDVANDDDMRWLDALIWPGHHHRGTLLRAAADIVRADPPRLVHGDLLTDLPALAAQAPPEATLVIFHSAVLMYVSPQIRAAFAALVRGLPAHWVSNEGVTVMPELAGAAVATPHSPAAFLLAVDGRPVAFTAPHGQAIQWFGP